MTVVAPVAFAALLERNPDQAPVPEPAWRAQDRQDALMWLGENRMPDRRDEPWHYMPTDQVLELFAAAVPPTGSAPVTTDEVDLLAGDHGGIRIVFVNGTFDPDTSRLSPDATTSVVPFSLLADDDTSGGSGARPLDSPRTDGTLALNAAAATDGASITVRAGGPAAVVHVVHVSVPDADHTHASHPLHRIDVASGAEARIVESFVGSAGVALVNAATEITVADGGRLEYSRVQSEGRESFHLGSVVARIGAEAEFHAVSVTLGAALSRVAFDVTLAGDGSAVSLDGLYLPTGEQHHDHMLTVQHAANDTRSDQRYKGVIDGRARGSFTGHVLVDPDIVGTTAHQANHNILLSSHAEADTRPWLEILSDDVRCTHGATVGRLDDGALFYLRSRGIPEAMARGMLIEGFAREVIEAMHPETLRHHVTAQVTASQGQHPDQNR